MSVSRPPVPSPRCPRRSTCPRWSRRSCSAGRPTRSSPGRCEASAGRPQWNFYEGPPTANGRPGTHHIEARAFKDVFPRFKTMQGWHVPRRAGWDCHGLPVEIAVEQELGFAGQARHRALRHRRVQRPLPRVGASGTSTRSPSSPGGWATGSTCPPPTGRWTRPTSRASGGRSSRSSTRACWSRTTASRPYCPRCGTGLSDHEVAQGYETLTDPSVYVRLPVTSGEWAGKADLLVWTTTPWTLPSNTAVAVHPDVTYVVARTGDGRQRHVRRRRAAARRRPRRRTPRCWPARPAATGSGCTTSGPSSWSSSPRRLPEQAHYVVLADYVTTDDGTGLVHQSPAFGAEDLAVCRGYGLPVVNPIDATGHFLPEVPLVGGHFFKAADADAGRGPAGPRRAVPRAALRAQLSALLALPHAAHVLRAAVLVHPHQRRSRTSCSPRTRRRTGTRRTSRPAATATG